MSARDFKRILQERVVVFDGGMGATLQRYDLSIDDYQGLENCSEIICVSRPEVVKEIHAGYFEAGADCVETNTFGANRVVLEEFGVAGRAYELNAAAARLARAVADDFETPDRPRFVAGSIGPGTKSPTLGDVTFDRLAEAYEEQARGLLDGGADLLIVETCFDLLQAKSAIVGCEEAFRAAGRKVPLIVQVTIERQGAMLLGSDVGAACAVISAYASVDAVGINCATGPAEMAEHVRALCRLSDRPVSVQPNAGLPENVDGRAVFPLQPEELARAHKRFIEEFGARIVGGCCGTTAEHIKATADLCANLTPAPRDARIPPSASSLYASVPFQQDPKPLIVGEEANAVGSRRFKEFVLAKDYDAMALVGKKQAEHGAHIVDLCVALTGEDEVEHMTQAVRRMAAVVRAPLMIDTTEIDTLEAALKLVPGRPVVNSINLEDGEGRLDRVMELVKRFGAAVVALTIDEAGMAKTADRKIEVAKRIHGLVVEKWGLDPGSLIFDPLTFTLGSGDAEFRDAALHTMEGVRRIKAELPGVHTLLGLSNVSFGLDPAARPILNSVFLHCAIEAGLDMAIVNARKIVPLFKIPGNERELARRLIFNESPDALMEFIAHFQGAEKKSWSAGAEDENSSVEEKLTARVLDGEKTGIEALLDEALTAREPTDVLNNVLLPAMRKVGDLMATGEMQLPFVLQSAEVMRAAVNHLEPMMAGKGGARKKGSIVLATVKGDVHDIGKNLVEIILRNNGYETHNLGIKQPAGPILDAARERGATAVGLSGLLVKSTVEMKHIVEAFGEAGLNVPVLCGGAALTRKYVEESIRPGHCADVYYAADAFEGLRIMDEFADPALEKKLTGGARRPAPPRGGGKAAEGTAKRAPIRFKHEPPKPPFWGARALEAPPLETLYGYVHEKVLFKQQYGVRGFGLEKHRERDAKLKGEVEALKKRAAEEKWLRPAAVYGYFPCQSEGDGLIVYADPDGAKERVRFPFPRQADGARLCLADYFFSVQSGVMDAVAFQIVTVGAEATAAEKKWYAEDRYKDYLYLHGLSVETAEAMAEFVHRRIRLDLGVAEGESENAEDLFRQRYRGRRYSYGYGACPELAEQAKILDLLDGEKALGVRMTDGDMLDPEQSTSAIVVHHPQARYFTV